jgi:pSer/pThr/pTyr-binding forkhead associated (FHA) protein
MINIQLFLDKELIHEYAFSGDTTFVTIGRHPAHDIHIDNLAVSGDHAKLSFEAYHVVIEDMKSSNGTLLNGMLINCPTAMNPGDIIQIGKFTLQVSDKRCGIADLKELTTTVKVNVALDKTGFYSYKDFLKSKDENP